MCGRLDDTSARWITINNPADVSLNVMVGPCGNHLKTDQETSIVDIRKLSKMRNQREMGELTVGMRAVKEMDDDTGEISILWKHPSIRRPQSNGVIENANKHSQGLMRTPKPSLDTFLRTGMKINSSIWLWLVEF